MQIPRFYPILDTETARRYNLALADAAGQILEAGARILQFRHKGIFSRAIFAHIEQIAERCREHHATLVINDRADLARLFQAALHLGQEDLTPSQARIVTGPSACIGYSTHNAAQLDAAAAEPADYLALGPIFGTSSKSNPDPIVGLEGLRRLRPLTDRPVVAIGGITRANARSVLEAGADSVAVISDLYPNIRANVSDFLNIVEAK